jgi:hypothetical protein
MEAAEQEEREHAEQARAGEQAAELELDALDAAAAAQDAEVGGEDELQPTATDVQGEVAEDEFDRAVDAGPAEHAEPA